MASVVFFRAANVGGYQTFSPAGLARDLAEFDFVNVGAAGTFVVRSTASAKKIRAEILRRLPFQPELMICPAADLLELARGDHFADPPRGQELGQFVSVMQQAPARGACPKLPFDQPGGNKWEVRLIANVGNFVLSFRRKLGPRGIYPNPIVEKLFATSATTRNWNTIAAIGRILER